MIVAEVVEMKAEVMQVVEHMKGVAKEARAQNSLPTRTSMGASSSALAASTCSST